MDNDDPAGNGARAADFQAIEAALETFEKIGAAGWAAKARAELGRISGRTREEGLTAAEQRVAQLVLEPWRARRAPKALAQDHHGALVRVDDRIPVTAVTPDAERIAIRAPRARGVARRGVP